MRLAKAEGEVSMLLDRSNKLEVLARDAQEGLEEERRLRREAEKRHACELQRATGEAAAGASRNPEKNEAGRVPPSESIFMTIV